MDNGGFRDGGVIHARATDERVPFKDGFLFGDLLQLANLRLVGSRCQACGIALWGVRRRCENCASPDLTDEAFATLGTVHTWTVQRYAPPPPYVTRQPWSPRPIAWIDLDGSGPRVLAPVRCLPTAITIGLRVRLVCGIEHVDEQQRDVVGYGFVPLTDVLQ